MLWMWENSPNPCPPYAAEEADDFHRLRGRRSAPSCWSRRERRRNAAPDRPTAQRRMPCPCPSIPRLMKPSLRNCAVQVKDWTRLLARSDIDDAVVGDVDAVRRVELLRSCAHTLRAPRGLVVRFVAVSTPVALVLAGLGVEHNHTAVAVAVGNKYFVGLFIHGDASRPISESDQCAGRKYVTDGVASSQHYLRHDYARLCPSGLTQERYQYVPPMSHVCGPLRASGTGASLAQGTSTPAADDAATVDSAATDRPRLVLTR